MGERPAPPFAWSRCGAAGYPHHQVTLHVLTRFAPAPTGYLHLGHVVNALYVWGAARQQAGQVLLRIEDHDRQRSRAEFESAIIEDLTWLGFAHDGAIVRQSERAAIYPKALQRLIDRGLVYGCTCTRSAVASGAGSQEPGTGEPRYPNTCRARGIPLSEDVGWRVIMEPGVEHFVDEILGPQQQDPGTQFGDLLVRDRRGNWTYQFAVTVDDHLQRITDVIRGEDLLPSTGRQLRLARMLGRTAPPRFWHHPLVMKSPSQKLSKSNNDTGVRDLRASGWTRDQVLEKARALSANLPL
jgi:glutamyl/glutaminyl-tRNA synthetase